MLVGEALEIKNMNPPENPSEAAKYKHLLLPYLHGNVIDIGSGGWPVVPHAIQIEQEDEAFAHYTAGRQAAVPIQWRQNDGIVNLPFKDGTVDAVHCLPTGTMVPTPSGMRVIQDVEIGDTVYGTGWKPRKVVGKYAKLHSGKVLEMDTPASCLKFASTPGHLMPIMRDGKRVFQNASQIIPGDFLAVPIGADSIDVEHLNMLDVLPRHDNYFKVKAMRESGMDIDEIARESKLPRTTVWQWYTGRKTPHDCFEERDGMICGDGNIIPIQAQMPLDVDMLRLIGYYISDGCASNKQPWAIAFYFAPYEPHFRQDAIALMKRFFGLDPLDDDPKTKPNIQFCRFCSKIAWHFFRKMGGLPRDKRIADVLMKLPVKKQEGLISGMWRGDGAVSRDASSASYSTSSLFLALQVRDLLARQGWPSSMYSALTPNPSNPRDLRRNYRIHVFRSPVDTIADWTGRPIDQRASEYRHSFEPKSCRIQDGFLWVKVRSVTPKEYSGMVYDLTLEGETEDEHLFIANGVLNHNSSHLLEDFTDWWPLLREWSRVVKRGGYLVILIPDKTLWREALRKGQPPNCAHRHEGYVGELSTYAPGLGLEVLKDELTNCCHGIGNGGVQIKDYSIIFVARKPL